MGLTRAATGAGAADIGRAVRRERPDDRLIALAGNPNVGKSTVFNALTGLRQHTGNWPGKTVTTAQGRCERGGRGYVLVDLPGTYSLLARSAEEEVARDFLRSGGADGAVVVCDATCLERGLILALQVIGLMPRTVVCVNLLDEAERRGIRVDLEALSARLGVPVVGASAGRGEGLSELLDAVEETVSAPEPPRAMEVRYPPAVEFAVSSLRPLLEGRLGGRLPARQAALRLLEGDAALPEPMDEPLSRAVEQARDGLRRAGVEPEGLGELCAAALVSAAEEAAAGVVTAPAGALRGRAERLLTSRIAAVPLMLLLLAGVLWLTIAGANVPSRLLSAALFWAGDRLGELLAWLNAPAWLLGALVDGVYRVLAWVVSVMLPPMAIFFPLFTLLEDLGYLPRVAFVLDHAFQKARACGKQALTMSMGFGCNAAGVVGCRIIDSPRERLIAILTNSFVPCNGRFPPPAEGQIDPRQQGLQHLQPGRRILRRRRLHDHPPGPVFPHGTASFPHRICAGGCKKPPARRSAGRGPWCFVRSDSRLLWGKFLRRAAELPLQQAGQPPHQLLRLLPHVAGEPADHDPGDGVHVEVGEEVGVRLRQAELPGLPLQAGGGNGPGQAVKGAVQQVVPAGGAVDVIDHHVVVPDVAEGVQQGRLPVLRPAQGLRRLVLQEPAQQVVDVLKVIIEGLAVDFAGLHQLLDRDVVQELFLQLRLQGVRQSQLGAGGHPPHLLRGFHRNPLGNIIPHRAEELQSWKRYVMISPETRKGAKPT